MPLVGAPDNLTYSPFPLTMVRRLVRCPDRSGEGAGSPYAVADRSVDEARLALLKAQLALQAARAKLPSP